MRSEITYLFGLSYVVFWSSVWKNVLSSAWKNVLSSAWKNVLSSAWKNVFPSTGPENNIAQPKKASFFTSHFLFHHFSPFNCHLSVVL